jgi:hypothetical protein
MAELKDDREAGRFEILEAGQTVFADYRLGEGRLIIDHVETPPVLRGGGAAGRLMQAIADHARAEGLGITPLCGYATAWLRRHPEYAGLIR